jgi:hypothetical protein
MSKPVMFACDSCGGTRVALVMWSSETLTCPCGQEMRQQPSKKELHPSRS